MGVLGLMRCCGASSRVATAAPFRIIKEMLPDPSGDAESGGDGIHDWHTRTDLGESYTLLAHTCQSVCSSCVWLNIFLCFSSARSNLSPVVLDVRILQQRLAVVVSLPSLIVARCGQRAGNKISHNSWMRPFRCCAEGVCLDGSLWHRPKIETMAQIRFTCNMYN